MPDDDFQFYPTPPALAERAWQMFQKKDPDRVLDPSAGNGDLLLPGRKGCRHYDHSQRHRGVRFDAIEINPERHPLLLNLGVCVVGHDFLEFTGVGLYSHVIMNPPFAQGAQHLLHAWDHLYDGEIVCILNAETLRNPYSKERQHLVGLIQRHGRVEFAQEAFVAAERKTDVEIALVHLVKRAAPSDLLGNILEDLRNDAAGGTLNFDIGNQLAVPTGFVEESVLRFDAAVRATRDWAKAEASKAYYANLLGRTLADMKKSLEPKTATQNQAALDAPSGARNRFAAAYDELKDQAWTSVLYSTEVSGKVSLAARQRIESEFAKIKRLEFTAVNVYGFLRGLCESQGEIQEQMMLDVFDQISCYHEDNVVFYMGWKSNGKHRTLGMRLKTTRFVLPGFGTEKWQNSLGFDPLQRLSDMDRVFAMLDGKHQDSIFGLRALLSDRACFDRLRNGSRETSDYFEVRYYPKRGTMHFFPKSKELMDRLNRYVGKRRQWIPHAPEAANADWHAQYEQADAVDKGLRSRVGERNLGYMVRRVTSGAQHMESVQTSVSDAMGAVMDEHGWNPGSALEYGDHEQRLLLAA